MGTIPESEQDIQTGTGGIMNEMLNYVITGLIYTAFGFGVILIVMIPIYQIVAFFRNKAATRALRERLIRELGKLFIVFTVVLALCGPVAAEVYKGNINGQVITIDVKNILPELGVMNVYSNGQLIWNTGWYQDHVSGYCYGSGVVFVVDGQALEMFWPVWVVFWEVEK